MLIHIILWFGWDFIRKKEFLSERLTLILPNPIRPSYNTNSRRNHAVTFLSGLTIYSKFFITVTYYFTLYYVSVSLPKKKYLFLLSYALFL